jgi:hypothetical protein
MVVRQGGLGRRRQQHQSGNGMDWTASVGTVLDGRMDGWGSGFGVWVRNRGAGACCMDGEGIRLEMEQRNEKHEAVEVTHFSHSRTYIPCRDNFV